MSLALVTGGSGFAGQHLVRLLEKSGVEVSAPTRASLDLSDEAAVRQLMASVVPQSVFHLAAFSSATRSWERPSETVLGNIQMTLSLLEAVRLEAPEARVVLVGSGQVYGEAKAFPVDETSPLQPSNPYATSKVSCDMLGLQYGYSFGLRISRMRPFNHAGPGQADEYVVSSLARQLAEAEERGDHECVLRTGNPDSARDFTDVRDVVRAYAMATEAEPNAYNVCSGSPTSVAELVEILRSHSTIPIVHEVDASRMRAHDAPVFYGSHDRLTAASGWQPEIPIEVTVRDTLDWWRAQVGARTVS